MNNFPFFGFPYNNYYRYYNYRNNLNKNIYQENNNIQKNTCKKQIYNNDSFQNNNCKNITDSESTNCKNDNNKLIKNKNKSSKLYLGPIVFDSSSFSDSEKPVLEFLGLKLYLDDILIISLLYFLYEEDVKDDTLFISLLLLLIS